VTAEEFETVVRRLSLNSDYLEVIKYLRRRLEERTEELVYRHDTVGTHRLQGCVAELGELLKDLAP
jgi:hypothetical protein